MVSLSSKQFRITTNLNSKWRLPIFFVFLFFVFFLFLVEQTKKHSFFFFPSLELTKGINEVGEGGNACLKFNGDRVGFCDHAWHIFDLLILKKAINLSFELWG
jgi:hypothetical protein